MLALLALPTPSQAANPTPVPALNIALGESVAVRVSDARAGFIELGRASGDPGGERAADNLRFTLSNMGG